MLRLLPYRATPFRCGAPLVLLGMAILLGGCASPFQKAWTASQGEHRQTGQPRLERYRGRWQSTSGAHSGQLECVLSTPGPAAQPKSPEQVVVAYFHAHYGALASNYQVELQGRRVGGVLEARGQKDLGPLQGGVYHYAAKITPTRLDAEYTSKYDRGTFTLRGPASPVLHGEKERP